MNRAARSTSLPGVDGEPLASYTSASRERESEAARLFRSLNDEQTTGEMA